MTAINYSDAVYCEACELIHPAGTVFCESCHGGLLPFRELILEVEKEGIVDAACSYCTRRDCDDCDAAYPDNLPDEYRGPCRSCKLREKKKEN